MRQHEPLRMPVLVLAFLVGGIASPGIVAAPASDKAVSVDPFALALDEKMPGLLSKYDVPGAVVAYIQDGTVAWTKAYGVADCRTGRPLRPEAVFNFASAAKALTAWGVMRLVETGKIELDAPAERYLKRWHLPPSEFDPNEVAGPPPLSRAELETGVAPGRSCHSLQARDSRIGLPRPFGCTRPRSSEPTPAPISVAGRL